MTTRPEDLADYLDGDASPSAAPPEGIAADAAGAELFVHGVLSHLAAGDDAHAARVTAALAAIDRHRRRRPWRIAAAAAAVLAVCALLGHRLGRGGDALLEARARQVVDAAAAATDLRYTMRVRAPDGAEREGTLLVRGTERFVVTIDGPLGGIVFGYDGREAWLVPAAPVAPVLVSRFPDDVRQDLWRLGVPLPFLSLASLLQGLDADFELREGRPGRGWRLLGTRRRAFDRLRPARIDVDADPATGRAHRLELVWDRARSSLPGLEIVFELAADGAAVDPGAYGHAAHHDAARRVRVLRR